MRLAVFVVILVVWVTACGGAQQRGTPHMPEISGEAVGLWVLADEEPLPIFILEDRYYLLGIEGSKYTIGLANRTDTRIEVVVSVDGRDVISGEVADYRTNRGYVIHPGEQIAIEGFRQSLDQVAAFEFVAPQESYAVRMGDGASVGVIGIAVFEEQPTDERQAIAASSEAKRAPEASAQASGEDEAGDDEQRIGTKYGESVGSAAEIVPFRRHNPEKPSEVLAVYYNDRDGLENIGIVFPENAQPIQRDTAPDPFPGVRSESGFAPAPPRN